MVSVMAVASLSQEGVQKLGMFFNKNKKKKRKNEKNKRKKK